MGCGGGRKSLAAPSENLLTIFYLTASMITAKQIRELMNAQPFRPFRIHLSNGIHHDITNHDMAFVGRNMVEIGLNLDPDNFAEYFTRCSILHITELEDLSESIAN
jgi:hypothetical protein